MKYTLKEVNKNIEILSLMLERVVEEEKEKKGTWEYSIEFVIQYNEIKTAIKDSLYLWGNINQFKK
jgi:hypothetical protein